MSDNPKQITTEIVQQNPWWSYKHDTFTLPTGAVGDYYYGESPGAAMVVPVLTDGRLVLVGQYRYLRDKWSIEFPCGGIVAGEQPSVAAKRELLEETGGEADELINIGTFDPLNGLFKDWVHLFLATEVEMRQAIQNTDNETTEIILRRPDEFEDMIRRGEIWDGETLAAWAIARERVVLKKV